MFLPWRKTADVEEDCDWCKVGMTLACLLCLLSIWMLCLQLVFVGKICENIVQTPGVNDALFCSRCAVLPKGSFIVCHGGGGG